MEVMKGETTLNSPAANEYILTSYLHSSIILYELNDLRKEGKFCDVIIEAGSKKYPAHKCILSAFSPHFKNILDSFCMKAKTSIITFNHIDAEIMQLLLDYAYTGTITITKANCCSLIAVAHYFTVVPVMNAAFQFLASHLNMSNFVEIYKIAEQYTQKELKDRLLNFALANFNCIVENECHLAFSADDLIRLTTNDKLQVEKEEDVFFIIKQWFDEKPEERIYDLYKVLQTVRFPLLNPFFLNICPDTFPSIRNHEECMQLIEDAKRFHFAPDSSSVAFHYQTKPRNKAYDGIMQVLALFGGTSAICEELATAECFQPGFNKQYSLAINFPVAISTHSIIQSENSIYMLGGCQNGKPSKELWEYDVPSNSWQKMAPMEIPRCYFGLVELDDYLYAIGGGIADEEGLKKQFDSVERYSLITNSWCSIGKFKNAIICPAVVAYDHKIYVAGGANYRNTHGTKSLYRYDPKEDSWTELTPMMYLKWGAVACALDGFIYVIGGCYTNNVLRYNIKEDIWQEMSHTNKKRARFGAAVFNKKIYILGGMETEKSFNDTVECYNPEKNRWKIVGKMMAPRESFGCVSLNVEKSLCQEIIYTSSYE